MKYDQLDKREKAEVRGLVAGLRRVGVYESSSQVAQNFAAASAWAAGTLPLDELCRRTGWTVAPADESPAVKDEEPPTHVEHNGERVLRMTWRQFQAREHNVGGWLVRFQLPGGYDYSEYLTEEYELVEGDQTRAPRDGDLVYAKIKTDRGQAGRPRVGAKVETRLPNDLMQRVDEFAAQTSRSRADALRVLIATGLQHAS